MADQPFQSLYRRYRPQRFVEVRGQEHVTKALRNAVRDDRGAHAYLFSGPRGTGKTSTARILAKALNCLAPVEGEPCDECRSCVEVRGGTSFDVHELDAASNRGIDDIRRLVEKASMGSPGRHKVYIVDEVHQLTKEAASALLKTLEEPPEHVVFVLATTDPQKVFPTIKSRTQHYDFKLLPPDELGALVRDINDKAGLGLAPEDLDVVVRRGSGSARDTLSVLDQAAAAGTIADDSGHAGELAEALCERDAGRVLVAVGDAVSAGRDPRRIAVDLLEHLRHAFLMAMGSAALVPAADDAKKVLEEQARRMGTPALVRAIEVIGTTLVEMREALDTRVALEVALVRVAKPEADTSPAAILERLQRLEQRLASGGGAGPAEPAPAAAHAAPVAPAGPATPTPAGTPATADPGAASSGSNGEGGRSPGIGGVAAARARLAAGGSSAPTSPTPSAPATTPPPPPRSPSVAPSVTASAAPAPPSIPPRPTATASASASVSAPGTTPAPRPAPADVPDVATLAGGWPSVVESFRPRVKALYKPGRFLSVDERGAVLGVPNEPHLRNCEPHRAEVEAALRERFGVAVPLRLVVDASGASAASGDRGAGGPAAHADEDLDVRPEELEDAPDAPTSAAERLKQAFPGAEEVATHE